jgi:hypothetical protein
VTETDCQAGANCLASQVLLCDQHCNCACLACSLKCQFYLAAMLMPCLPCVARANLGAVDALGRSALHHACLGGTAAHLAVVRVSGCRRLAVQA